MTHTAVTCSGVFLLARELTGSPGWGAMAAALYALLPANYRTLGFCFIREDFCLPFFALHLGLAARAARVRTPSSFALAGLAAGAAAATWHAMGSFFLIELACLVAWYLRTGHNPLRAPGAWIAPVVVAAVALLVPVLRAKLFIVSTPMQVALALALAGVVARRRALGRWAELAVFGAGLGALMAIAVALARATGTGLSDYAHVIDFFRAKLVHLGVKPDDPSALSIDVRLLWQGPFETADLGTLALGLATGLVAILWAAIAWSRAWVRGSGDARLAIAALAGLALVVVTWLVVRTQAVTGLLAPALFAALLAQLRSAGLARALATAALALQALLFIPAVLRAPIAWYDWPAPILASAVQRHVGPVTALRREREHVIAWLDQNLPAGAPVASDFLNAAAILAFTGHPVTQQPKYETVRSRERIGRFFTEFFAGTLESFTRELERVGARYLVLDRPFLGGNGYIGGLPLSQRGPSPRTPAAAFLDPRPQVYAGVPTYRLVYETPAELDGRPSLRSFVVYELARR